MSAACTASADCWEISTPLHSMSKQLLIFFGVGVVAIAIAVVVILTANKGAHLQLQGKILKVRTGALGEGNSIAVLDFRVENPSDVPFVVRNVEMTLEKQDGEMADGVTVSKSDLKQLFQYNRFLGDQYNDGLGLEGHHCAAQHGGSHGGRSLRGERPGSGERQSRASEHSGCGWSAVGDQPRASTKLPCAPADDSTGRHRRLHPVAARDRVSSNGLHGSLGAFRCSAADSVCGSAGDCIYGNRLARPAGRGTAAGLIAQLAVVRFDCFLVRLESRGVSRAGARAGIAVPIPGCFAGTRREDSRRGFLSAAGGRRGLAVPRIECARVARGDFAVIHPFSGSARKNWPLERFREVAARLAMPVRWCAGPDEALDGCGAFRQFVRTGVLARDRPHLHRQRFRHHASGRRRRDAGGRDLRADRSGGVGAAGRASTRGQRKIGGDQGGCGIERHREWYSNAMKSTIDRAGRVVIPKAIREAAGLKPGSALTIAYRDGQVVIEPKSPNAANQLGIAQNCAVRSATIIGTMAGTILSLLKNLARSSVGGGQMYDGLIASAADAGATVLLIWNVRHFTSTSSAGVEVRELKVLRRLEFGRIFVQFTQVGLAVFQIDIFFGPFGRQVFNGFGNLPSFTSSLIFLSMGFIAH